MISFQFREYEVEDAECQSIIIENATGHLAIIAASTATTTHNDPASTTESSGIQLSNAGVKKTSRRSLNSFTFICKEYASGVLGMQQLSSKIVGNRAETQPLG